MMKDMLNKITAWVGTDGLLHFLVCYAMMLTLSPRMGTIWAIVLTALVALAKEAYDIFIQRDNDKNAAIHDLICDVVGMFVAVIITIV